MDCIFCKIICGDIKSEKLFENENFICIKDIHPQAKKHFLVVPKKHIESLDSLDEVFTENLENQDLLMGQMLRVGTQVAREQGLLPGGFRSVINTKADGGQTVFHLHLHILGGGRLGAMFG